MKIKLSHIDQVATDQNVNGVYIKLQVRWTITHEPGKNFRKSNPEVFKGEKKKLNQPTFPTLSKY